MKLKVFPGLRVQTHLGEQDTDNEGAPRYTQPGAWGHISSHNHVDHWNLVFPNGACVVVTEAELQDATQYWLDQPRTLEECALALQYGQDHLELTILDDWMMPLTEQVAGNPKQILDLFAGLRSIKELAPA